MTKAQAISQMILDRAIRIAEFHSIPTNSKLAVSGAIDHVLGAGTYDKLVSDLYDELRAKGAQK